MRIISGIFKGKKIIEPKNKITRPLKDMTKESIFNILLHSNQFLINFENSKVLDLFSGVGSFGIECISRGVEHVTFFENYDQVLPILKKNLKNLNIQNKCQIIEKDVFENLDLKYLPFPYEIIFLDPPFKIKDLTSILVKISNEKIYKKNGIIIIHRHKKSLDTFPKNFKIKEKKIYGNSKIIFGNF